MNAKSHVGLSAKIIPTLYLFLVAFCLPPLRALAQNTADNFTGSGTASILTAGNWSLGGLPTVTNDAVFTATTGVRTMTAGNLTVGSFNVTASSGTFTIRSATATATDSILTLGGAGNLGNAVSGTAGDLLYAATGSAFSIAGTNGSTGTGVVKVNLGQSGNFNAAGTLTVSAAISDGGSGYGITKTGTGTLTLSGANTYDGQTLVTTGVLTAAHNQALGSTLGNTVVSSNAAVQVSGGITVNEAISIEGSGVGTSGALLSSSGSNTWAGAITWTSAGSRIGASKGSTLRITGGLSNSVPLTLYLCPQGALWMDSTIQNVGGTVGFINGGTNYLNTTGNNFASAKKTSAGFPVACHGAEGAP